MVHMNHDYKVEQRGRPSWIEVLAMGECLESIDLIEQVDIKDRDDGHAESVRDYLKFWITYLGFGRRYGHIDNRRQ